MAALLLPAAAGAQVTPPREGVELPPGYYERLQSDRNAFRFRRAWKAETRRVQRRRDALRREGVLSLNAGDPGIRVQGTRRVPVLVGKFANTGPDPYTEVDLQEQLFDGPNPTGTMTDYYHEISYGYLNLTGDVIGAQGGGLFTVSQNDTYYEGSCNGLCASANTGEYITELLDAGDPWVDFSQYDNDGPDGLPNSGDDDGYVDFVAFVHPERGGECGGSNLWSHRWVYEGWYGTPYVTDDPAAGGGFIRVSDYTIQPLLSCDSSSLIEIGVFSHEFGHAFGLPDLYDTDSGNGSSAGVGNWCLMGTGSWGGDGTHPETPSHMSAWCKEQLGWADPLTVCEDQFGIALPAAADTGAVLRVYPHGIQDDEYFLIENRVQTGFDTHLPESGIAVWHVDGKQSGNGDETHKLLDLEEADGLGEMDANLNRGDAGDVFPGSDNVQLFDDDTNPDARDYAGNPTGLSLSSFDGTADPRGFDLTVTGCRLAVSDVTLDDSFLGNNNHTLDGNEQSALLVSLRNDFPDDVTGVAGTLTSLTAGVSVLSGNVTYGTVTAGVLNPGDAAFVIEATGALADGQAVDFQLDLSGDAGYSSTSTVSIHAGSYVVLVEDDAGSDNLGLFTTAISGAGYAAVHHDVSLEGTPPPGLLQGALAVAWYTGIEGFNTFTPGEQDLVADFLDGGGALFVTGQDLGWGLVEQGSAADATFYQTYLHADYVADTSSDNTLTGLPGDPIGDGLSLNLAYGTGANNSTWPSWIAPRSGAAPVFEYSAGVDGAIRYAGAHKVVYFAFNFESINSASTRATTMGRVLDWLRPADVIPPSVTLTSPVAGDTLGACGTHAVTWSASDDDAVAEVDLYLSEDGGSTWGPLALGLPNSGSHAWSPGGASGSSIRIKVLARDPGGLQGSDTSGDFVLREGLPAVAVTAPAGGEVFPAGDPVPIAWSMSDSCSGAIDSSRVDASFDGGSSWLVLATVPAPDSTWTWTETDSTADSVLVRVTVFDALGESASDTAGGPITLADAVPPLVELLAPVGGESFGTGTPVSIDWIATDNQAVTGIDLYHSGDAGATWTEIATGLPNTPPYEWTVAAAASEDCLIRIRAWDAFANAAADTSDSTFAIYTSTAVPPDLAGVTRPVLLQNFPNPMSELRTTFAFYLPAENRVLLQIHDLSGRLVRTLVDGTVNRGYHEVPWDGLDDAGRGTGTGIYFTVMTTPERQEMRKLVKLR